MTQSFQNGEICEVTGKPRETMVLFKCVPGSAEQITVLREVSTCVYEITVVTDVLCPKQERVGVPLLCHAVDSDSDHSAVAPQAAFNGMSRVPTLCIHE